MADDVTLDGPGTGGAVIATDDISSVHYQKVKLVDGTDQGTALIGAGGGVEATALRVTVASDSTGVLSVDDNASSLTVDTTGTSGLEVVQVTAADLNVTEASAATIAGDTTSLDSKVTACDTGAVVVASGTVTAVTDITNTVTVDNAGTFAVQADLGVNNDVTIDGSSVVSVDDTTVHATGVTEGLNIMAAATPTDGSVAANDIGMVAMSTDRRLHVDADITASVALDVSAATVTVDGSGVTQPVSAATLPLPTGAATSAKQLADGHNVVVASGSITADLGANNDVTIDGSTVVKAAQGAQGATDTGIAAMAVRNDVLADKAGVDGDYTPLQVSATGALYVTGGGGGTEPTLGTATYTEGTTVASTIAVVRKDAAGTLVNTDNELAPLQVDASGSLRVTGGGGGTEYTEDAAAAANPVGTALILVREDARAGSLTTTDNDNVALRGNNNGEAYVIDTDANAKLSTIDTDTGTIAGDTTSIDGKITACDTGAVVVASGTVTAVTDITNTVTVDNGGTFATQAAATLQAGSALAGDVGISGARTAGGTTIFRSIDLDEGTLEIIKASAGQIYWIHAINLAASVRFVKIYNAASGTIGTGTPVLTFPIPTQGDTNGAGFMFAVPNGVAFATGITIGASTGIADADTGAPGANEVVVNVGYA